MTGTAGMHARPTAAPGRPRPWSTPPAPGPTRSPGSPAHGPSASSRVAAVPSCSRRRTACRPRAGLPSCPSTSPGTSSPTPACCSARPPMPTRSRRTTSWPRSSTWPSASTASRRRRPWRSAGRGTPGPACAPSWPMASPCGGSAGVLLGRGPRGLRHPDVAGLRPAVRLAGARPGRAGRPAGPGARHGRAQSVAILGLSGDDRPRVADKHQRAAAGPETTHSRASSSRSSPQNTSPSAATKLGEPKTPRARAATVLAA